MKKFMRIFASIAILATGSILAMQPQSKHDCFFAYTKFKANSQAMAQQNAVWDSKLQKIAGFYAEFVKECIEEKKRNVAELQRMQSENPKNSPSLFGRY